MIADIITFAIEHQFVVGLVIGSMGFGGTLGVIGWCLGHDTAMRKIEGWMRPKIYELHGDVPNLPPARDRRAIPTTPGRYL
jgi:hypothetical protein